MNKVIAVKYSHLFILSVLVYSLNTHAETGLLERLGFPRARQPSVSLFQGMVGSGSMALSFLQIFHQNREIQDKITREAERRKDSYHVLFEQRKSSKELLKEKKQRIRELKEKIAETQQAVRIGSGQPSVEEMRNELHKLLTEPFNLNLEQEDKQNEIVKFEPKPGALEQPANSDHHAVPGVWMAPRLPPTTGFTGSINYAMSPFLSVLLSNKSLPLGGLQNRQNSVVALNPKLPSDVSVEVAAPARRTRKVVHIHVEERVSDHQSAPFQPPLQIPNTLAAFFELEHIPLPPSDLQSPSKIQTTPEAFLELDNIPPPPESLPPKKKKETKADTKKALVLVELNDVPPPPELLPPKKTPIKISPKEDVLCASLERFYLLNARLIALDVEATGLGNDHKLTEIGGVEIQKGVVTGHKFQTYVNPEREVTRDAHKLTGYTWKFLKKYPLFGATAPHFLRFIQGAVLVIHNAHYDLKLINEALAACNNPYGKLEEKHAIVDTAVLARKLYPGKSSSLTAVCAYNDISTTKRHRHGALIDAELLAEVFQAMACKDNFDAILDIPLKMSLNDFHRWSEKIKHTTGEAFFRNIGIKSDLPLTFRFMPHLYHPQLCTHYPAILVAFSNQKDALSGIYARYLMPNTAFVKDPPPKEKIFYGSPENGMVTIHEGGPATLFVGNMLSALVAKDILLGHHAEQIFDDLHLSEQAGFSIKACFDLSCLLGMIFDSVTEKIVVLMDNDKCLKEIVEHFYNLKIELKILSLTGPDGTSVTQLARDYPDQLLHQMRNPVPIHALQDLLKNSPHQVTPEQARKKIEFARKIEQARKIYNSAFKKPSKPILEYFRQRGILGALPPSFRYFARAFHPWTERFLPMFIAPLFKRDGQITGIHRIFCEPNGTPISDKKHRKVSLGDTAFDVFIDIYKGSIQKKDSEQFGKKEGVTFISEGIENSLVARDVLLDTAKEDPAFAEKIYERLGITGCFDIRSCVGVNGLAEIPLNHNTRTVIILADNDGNNAEVKQVMINTVKKLLEENRIVKMVMAKGADGQKIDLNDVYLGPNGRQQVADLLYHAVTIRSVEDLGNHREPLQDSLQRLALKADLRSDLADQD
jgi:DNA polymerase-3 subunit epsilon